MKRMGSSFWPPVMLIACLVVPARVFGAFGLTTNTDHYTVDTGAGLVFKVRRTDNGVSTQSAGDLMSLVFNGVEYQNQSRGSQVNSGFDFLYTGVSAVSVSAQLTNVNYIKVTVTAGNLTHYYMARNGYPHIYMATHFLTEPDTLGLCRYIVRIPSSLLPNGPPPSDIRNNTGAIESGDIFGMADGTTRSKHYSNHRLLDWACTGATGNNVGVFMVRGTHEGDSGGPFYRSLINQCGSDQEIYEIVNYGEAQTEAFRTNILNGPYTLAFTDGRQPATNLDYSWIESGGLNLIGWVSNADRGAVTGTVSGVPAGFQAVVGFANAQAQYWAVAASDGIYTTPLMIPGTYTATLYKQELAVATAMVTVSAGVTNTLNLTSTESTPTFIWRLGDWDGTPAGFLNADKLTTMHPSDIRMGNWSPGDFVIESNTANQFPCAQFRLANSPAVIKFNLTPAQITTLTLRIGTTCAYINARPQVMVNSWLSSQPPSPGQPNTRSITVGTYRENNKLYTYSIPASGLVVGQNTLQINPISGSGDLGTFLSASFVYDAIELDGPVVNVTTVPTGLTGTPGDARADLAWNQSPGAASYTLKRANVSGGPYSAIASNLATAAFANTGLSNGVTYFYVVSGVNTLGASSNSAEVAVTPSPLRDLWKLDETTGTTATDSVGANPGILAAGATWVPGRAANAVHFNGAANSYVSLPDGLVSALDDFTIAAWVKTDTKATWSRIFDFGSGMGSYMFLTPASGGNTIRYGITLSSAGGEQQINNNAVLSTNVWHHLAVSLSNITGTLYLDGVAVGSNTNMTLKPSSLGLTTQNYFGKSQWNDPILTGSVDDFRIYSRALAPSEIAALTIVPNAPIGLTATAGDAQAALTWSAAANATGYNLKRAAVSGGPYSLVTNLPGTNFVNAGLSNGTLYYFVVSATNANYETANSAQVSVRPVSLAPVTIVPMLATGQLQLGWPTTHTGWRLEGQTNDPGASISTNWTTLSNSTQTNQVFIPVNPGKGSAYYRLVYP